MPFINKYTYPKSAQFNYAKEFIENTNAFVLSVGSYDTNAGIVSSLKPDGTINWELRFDLVNYPDLNLDFKKVVSAKFNVDGKESLQYIIHAIDGRHNFLVAIDESGVLLWSKQIPELSESQNCFMASCNKAKKPFILISEDLKNEKNSPIIISEIKNGGDFTNTNEISLDKSRLSASQLNVNGEHVTIAATVNYGESIYKPLTINLNSDLNEIFNYELSIDSVAQDAMVINQDTLIVSSINASNGKFHLSTINYEESNGLFKVISELDDNDTKIEIYKSGFYLLHHKNNDGNLRAFDKSLEPLWSQRIHPNSITNGLNSFVPDGRNYSIYSTPIDAIGNSLVCRTDDEFKNCKAVNIQNVNSSDEELSIRSLELSFRESGINTESLDVNITEISSTKQAICSEPTVSFEFGSNSSIQSPNFAIQTAGSLGEESSTGIHTRWLFMGALGELHLPKGNLASSNVNFNKPDDFVKLYRAKYTPTTYTLNLTQNPEAVNNSSRFWVYVDGDKEFKVYFKDSYLYDSTRQSINPLTNPATFLDGYGSGLIELHCNELFFKAKLNADSYPSGSMVRVELHSVPNNDSNALLVCSARKEFTTDFQNIELIAENGRIVKYSSLTQPISSIEFEFYRDQFESVSNSTGWTYLDQFSLTQDSSIAFKNLEPYQDAVLGAWKRFNGDDYVNTNNYKKRFNGNTDPQDRDLSEIIDQYISLSDSANNPTGIEQVDFYDEVNNTVEVVNLDILNLAAYDYHMARMLGLGYIDLDATVFDGSYIYLAQYNTNADLQDGYGSRYVQHFAMSLPTALQDTRMPLPIDIKELRPGIEVDSVEITDQNGYSHDGMSRYIQVLNEELPEYEINQPFFFENRELELHKLSYPIYAGLEHKLSTSTDWDVPELSHDLRYENVDANRVLSSFETRPINLPDLGQSLYVHKQKVSGTHVYSSYGINLFSRASSSDINKSITTEIKQVNGLIPPTNINSHLIQKERPLMLTSMDEQDRLQQLVDDGTKDDKTLLRVRFDYNSNHELKSYQIPINSTYSNAEYLDPQNANDPEFLFPDDEEIFADEVELLFRPKELYRITGKIDDITDVPGNSLLSRLDIIDYFVASQNTSEQPLIATGTASHYTGAVVLIGSDRFVVHQMATTPENATQERITQIDVYKKEVSQSIFNNGSAASAGATLTAPSIINGGYFICIENMQDENNWGGANPSSFKVQIGNNWSIKRELIQFTNSDGEIERHVEKSRGFWFDANVEKIDDDLYDDGSNGLSIFLGRYTIIPNGFSLNDHPQVSATSNSVEWHGGIVRIHIQGTTSNGIPTQTRKVLQVQKIVTKDENGNPIPLQLICRDEQFVFNSSDNVTIEEGANIEVNFYPGYRAYYYQDDSILLNDENTIPLTENIKTAMIGLRSVDDDFNPILKSKISPPFLLQIAKQVEPEQPLQPIGSNYATKPDTYGRSTYTFRTEYTHLPHGLLFYRTSDQLLLNALYSVETINTIKSELTNRGGSEGTFFANRYLNLLDFDALFTNGDFLSFPTTDGYKFPNPDKVAFFDWCNVIINRINESSNQIIQAPIPESAYGTFPAGHSGIRNFVKGAILSSFIPLTETPIIYEYINDDLDYKPTDRPQKLKDKNGHVLSPFDPEFDMAPMMKIVGEDPHQTQFTDFTLDGTTNNVYFYAARELSNSMQMGTMSPVLGPVLLPNTNPPETPEIKSVIPSLENIALGIGAHIRLEINAYDSIQNIKKFKVYRAFNLIDAQSIKTMTLAKEIDLETSGQLGAAVWSGIDDFDNLDEIPFGDDIYYRVVSLKEVKFEKIDIDNGQQKTVVTEYQPSNPSKIVGSIMVQNRLPESPVMKYYSEPIDSNGDINQITLAWNKTTYKGKYHVYKMNSQGNWNKIGTQQGNDVELYFDLLDTDVASASLSTLDADSNPVYHHFKVIAENSAGMLSNIENIMTLPNDSNWEAIGGISDMIINGTFRVN